MSVPTVLAMVGALVVLLAALYLARQFVVSRRRGAFECLLWRRALTGREGWQLGLMRYGTHRLHWYRAFSLRIRPELILRRSDILDIERRTVESSVVGVEQHVLLDLRMADGGDRRLLLARSAASGLLAWLEAAPAGSMPRGGD